MSGRSRRAPWAFTTQTSEIRIRYRYRRDFLTNVLPPNHPDAGTVAALGRGDREAFTCIVTELNPGLTRLARSYVPEALADEIVQETWMAVIKSIETFQGRSSLKSWIYRIMLNKVRTLAVREAKIVPFTSVGPQTDDARPSVEPERLMNPDLGQGYWPEAPVRWHTAPDERVETKETLERVHAAIQALPAAQREVVAMRDIEGWSAEEVCNALGISSVNQRVLLHRGRVAVREAVEEYLS